MPTAAQNETRDSVFVGPSSPKSWFAAVASTTRPLVAAVPDCVSRLVQLLAEDPVDLAQVSDEIRAQPALADVVKRVAASLQLAPEDSVSTIEEAAIILGTDRLRVLLSALPQAEKIIHGNAATASGTAAESEAIASDVAWTPESFYLASFVRFLGLADLDAGAPGEEECSRLPDGARSEAAAMTEILVRDFLSLVPRMRKSSGNV